MTKELSRDEREILLKTARQAIKNRAKGEKTSRLNLDEYSPIMREKGACFVTLTIKGVLRGCVGSLEATQPLLMDVQERAIGAAFNDPRFPSLTLAELDSVQVEISRLTKPEVLEYSSAQDLQEKLRPGIDGVILRHQSHRATFLPQVWEQLETPELFLSQLCLKMGFDSSAWKNTRLLVEIYQAEKFSEGD